MEKPGRQNPLTLSDNRTPVRIQPFPRKIHRAQRMLWLGSCFTEAMERPLLELGYQGLFNPMGVVYHPLVLSRLADPGFSPSASSFESGGVWLNSLLGREFGSADRAGLEKKILAAHRNMQQALRQADWVVVTWGTALAYTHRERGLAGRNHKLPLAEFTRSFSHPGELADAWVSCIREWKSHQPDLQVVFTLSPVRHTREGLEASSLSKAILRVAIEEIRNRLPDHTAYFPAYEIVVDDLRDYRFFAEDGVHPGPQAQEYILRAFEWQFFPPEEVQQNGHIRAFLRLKAHRPLHTFGTEYRKWQENLQKLEENLPPGYPLPEARKGDAGHTSA
jgi:hypothetical protein